MLAGSTVGSGSSVDSSGVSSGVFCAIVSVRLVGLGDRRIVLRLVRGVIGCVVFDSLVVFGDRRIVLGLVRCVFRNTLRIHCDIALDYVGSLLRLVE